MTDAAAVLIVRHAATAWSSSKRLQGLNDIPLSDAGRRQVAAWSLPVDWRSAQCMTSPLSRARETARILGFASAKIREQLIETDWGEFEGQRLDCLRSSLGEEMATNERRGLDFRPPNGESPREVAGRIEKLFMELAKKGGRFVLVTHKGIRNASIVLATGWDMTCKPPIRLGDEMALALSLSQDGKASVDSIISLI